MLRIITDFDGPIIDVSERYYQVYKYCLETSKYPEQAVNLLSKAEFWRLKKSRVLETQIGLLSGLEETQAKNFSALRRQTVHADSYFSYDSLAPGAVAALEKVQDAGIDLAVMTMRRVKELDYAFNCYDLDRFFPKNRCYCLTNDYIKTRDIDDKPLLMERALVELPVAEDTWMVGDTEADIIAAKNHGVKVIAVLCGIRDEEQLRFYNPDLIVETLSEAVDILIAKSLSQVA